MGQVVVDVSLSLDGFIAGPNPRPGVGLGEGGQRLHGWMFPPAGGPTEIDRAVIEDLFQTNGAMVMGRRSFTVGEGPWGENPPFHMPVFVQTHTAHARLVKEGGTSYTFVTAGLESAIAQAKAAAGDKNVCLHGATLPQQCLQAGLLDEIHLHLVPVLLGAGIRFFDHLDRRSIELEIMRVAQSPAVTHLRYRVVKNEAADGPAAE